MKARKKKPFFPHPPLDLNTFFYICVGGLFLEYQIPDTLAGRPWGSLEGNAPDLGVLGRACRKRLLPFFLSSW